jgi:hypothetical protein
MKADASAILKTRILELETELKADHIELKAGVKEILHSLRPAALIKSTVKDMVTSKDVKGDIIDSLIGLATGFVAKKMVIRGSGNPLIKVIGRLTELTVAKKVGSNAGGIRTIGGMLLKKLFHKNGQT